MRVAVVVHLTGVLVRLFSAAFLTPVALAVLYGESADAWGFLAAATATLLIGHVMRRAAEEPGDIRRVEAMAVVSATWLLLAALCAVPYVWAGLRPIDALFEGMSGLTTTGATVFTDFSQFGHAIFFRRSLTQWLGGLGVIALFVAILPRMAIGGRQLFFAEAPGPQEEKLTPQIRRTATVLWVVYVSLTLAEFMGLVLVGLPAFDAACHALSTLGAGGFSSHPLSIQGYANPSAEWLITGFMFLAGANFALQYRVLRGRPLALVRDTEFRAYTAVVVTFTSLCALVLWRDGHEAFVAIRESAFQVVSILTTTGFASADFNVWSDQAKLLLLLLMFVGGSAGSASGGPKVVRHVLLARFTLLELKQILHPRAILPVKLGGRTVPADVMRAVMVFFLVYVLAFAVCAVVLVLLGADLVTGISAAIACLGNIGPGFNEVGPMTDYSGLHPAGKLVLVAAMWIGRLEVLTVLAILRPEVWRRASWPGIPLGGQSRIPAFRARRR